MVSLSTERPICRKCKVKPVQKSGNKRKDGSPYWTLSCWSCKGSRTPLERFNGKYDVSPDGCWLWSAGKDMAGYGAFSIATSKNVSAHRWAYENWVGEIPDGFSVCHSCDVPACVNPDHLFIGTHKDNMADMVNKGRSTQGVRNANSKLTERDVLAIRATTGATQKNLAKHYGVSVLTIHQVITNKSWRHV